MTKNSHKIVRVIKGQLDIGNCTQTIGCGLPRKIAHIGSKFAYQATPNCAHYSVKWMQAQGKQQSEEKLGSLYGPSGPPSITGPVSVNYRHVLSDNNMHLHR